jgi:hypothetical protein
LIKPDELVITYDERRVADVMGQATEFTGLLSYSSRKFGVLGGKALFDPHLSPLPDEKYA